MRGTFLVHANHLGMAMPTPEVQSTTYYHGVPKEDMAQWIMANGITPNPNTRFKGWLTPVEGRVYLTDSLTKALYYACGEVPYSKSKIERNVQELSEYGYIFVIPGERLQDVQPDEDCIAEILLGLGGMYAHRRHPKRLPTWLRDLIREVLPQTGTFSLTEIRKIQDFGQAAQAAKLLLERMTDEQKLSLLPECVSISSPAIWPSECWRFKKKRGITGLIPPSEDSFFQIAEKIWEHP